jgi:hypothetical protein
LRYSSGRHLVASVEQSQNVLLAFCCFVHEAMSHCRTNKSNENRRAPFVDPRTTAFGCGNNAKKNLHSSGKPRMFVTSAIRWHGTYHRRWKRKPPERWHGEIP